MTTPILQEVKRKMVIGLLARGGLMVLLVGYFWFYYMDGVSVDGEVTPILYIFLGIFGLIFFSNVISYVLRMTNLLALVETMQKIAMSYGMEFVTEKTQLGKRHYFRPMECLIRGKRSGRDIVIFPAMDLSSGSGDKARSVTVFERPLGRNLVPVTIAKNSGLTRFVGSLMGGGKTVFRNDYVILSPAFRESKYMEGGIPKFKSVDEWQAVVLSQVEQIFPSDAMGIFEMLPGRNSLQVTNGSVFLIVQGYVKDLNEFEKYLTFMERLS